MYQNEDELDVMPGSDYEAIVRDAARLREELKRSGHNITSRHSCRCGRDEIRVRDGHGWSPKDPCGNQEQLGGYRPIEARDLDDCLAGGGEEPPRAGLHRSAAASRSSRRSSHVGAPHTSTIQN